MSVIENIFIN